MHLASAEMAFDEGRAQTPAAVPVVGAPLNLRSLILRQAGLLEAVELSQVRAGFRIGLIDGQVDTTHNALCGCSIHGGDTATSARARNHATFLASVLVSTENARATGATLGLCSHSTLINLSAISDELLDGSLSVAQTARKLSLAVQRTIDEGCGLILFGVAFRDRDHPDWSILRAALRRAAQAGILTIMPAGNNSDALQRAGQSWAETLTVASLDRRGIVSHFSLSDRRMRAVVFAPGEDVPGASGNQQFVIWSGSSGAAAIATGAIALGCSLRPDRSAFDIAGALFPSSSRELDGRRCLEVPSSRVQERELSYGT